MKKTVAITGASGFIGGFLVKGLAEAYNVRALARRPLPEVEGAMIADIRDLASLQKAFEGVDSVIHMAASIAPWLKWEDALENNIVGAYNIYEAAARAGVKQVIYASSNHAMAGYEDENAPDIYRAGKPLLDHNTPMRPDGFYGLSKCFGELTGRYYSDYHNVRAINLRIGWVNHEDTPHYPIVYENPERLVAIWLSQRDCLQLVEKSLAAEHVKFGTFYGISNNQPHFYDLEHAREVIGYEPEDGANVSDVDLQKVEWRNGWVL